MPNGPTLSVARPNKVADTLVGSLIGVHGPNHGGMVHALRHFRKIGADPGRTAG